MDSEAFSVKRLELRAFDLSERTIRRGEVSAVRRVAGDGDSVPS